MKKSRAARGSTVSGRSKDPIIVSNLEEWEECEEGDPDCEDVLIPVDAMQSEEYMDEEDEVLTWHLSYLECIDGSIQELTEIRAQYAEQSKRVWYSNVIFRNSLV